MAVVPKEYHGREQAFIKHTILKTYLQRLFMIVGRAGTPVINYVDCFAGPWSEEDSESLDDTSIGISLQQMKATAEALQSQFGRQVKFRALYVEKSPKAFKKLQAFIAQDHHPVDATCIKGDYTQHIDEIARWTQGHFTFFFVDPKGWKTVINAATLAPLLRLDKCEFLINLMYEFCNRALTIEQHEDDIRDLLGEAVSLTGTETAAERRELVQTRYREAVNDRYRGRSAFVPVERPGKDRVLYFLIYFTRHPIGITVFKEEAENMQMVQRITHIETKLRSQTDRSGMADMFAEADTTALVSYEDNRLSARRFLLEVLTHEPLLIDYERWADWLEQSDLYPSDFQLSMKDLIKEGLVANVDADVKRRHKKPIKPNWPNKSERWVRLTQ